MKGAMMTATFAQDELTTAPMLRLHPNPSPATASPPFNRALPNKPNESPLPIQKPRFEAPAAPQSTNKPTEPMPTQCDQMRRDATYTQNANFRLPILPPAPPPLAIPTRQRYRFSPPSHIDSFQPRVVIDGRPMRLMFYILGGVAIAMSALLLPAARAQSKPTTLANPVPAKVTLASNFESLSGILIRYNADSLVLKTDKGERSLQWSA